MDTNSKYMCLIDSGSNNHVFHISLDNELNKQTRIQFANKNNIGATKIGNIKDKFMILKNVVYSNEFQVNIISTKKKLLESGYKVDLQQNKCIISKNNFYVEINKNRNGLFYYQFYKQKINKLYKINHFNILFDRFGHIGKEKNKSN